MFSPLLNQLVPIPFITRYIQPKYYHNDIPTNLPQAQSPPSCSRLRKKNLSEMPTPTPGVWNHLKLLNFLNSKSSLLCQCKVTPLQTLVREPTMNESKKTKYSDLTQISIPKIVQYLWKISWVVFPANSIQFERKETNLNYLTKYLIWPEIYWSDEKKPVSMIRRKFSINPVQFQWKNNKIS